MKLHSVAALLVGCAVTGTAAQNTTFDWSSITPSTDLVFTSCYGTLQCARLEVPLNWNDTSDNRTMALAIAKLPAVVNDTDPTFAGSLWSNPGGPGHSGVLLMESFGTALQQKADIPGKRHYEVLSWDPRGVGFTTPGVDCWGGSVLDSTAMTLELHGTTGLERGSEPLTFSLSMYDAFGQKCALEDDTLAYVGTPNVARDMVEMIDKVEDLRDSNAAKSGMKNQIRATGDVARIQYVGFSYGTVLGAYFAALFPGRVGRMVLDGVVDSIDYATGPGWLTATTDTQKVFDQYLSTCFTAGPTLCPMTNENDTSAQEVIDRFQQRLAAIDALPIPFISPLDGSLMVITGDDIRLGMITILYNPIELWAVYAPIFEEVLTGNATRFGVAFQETGARPILDSTICGSTQPAFTTELESEDAVVCVDGSDVSKESTSFWNSYVQEQVKQSNIGGPYIATVRFPCAGWKVRPNWAFSGPFTFPPPDSSNVEGKPLAGILFTSNVLDPVAPLSSARLMASKFPGSGLVIQNATGHCALTTAPSNCTTAAFQNYLDTGNVPKGEQLCQPSCGPWDYPECAALLSPGSTSGLGLGLGIRKRSLSIGHFGRPQQPRSVVDQGLW